MWTVLLMKTQFSLISKGSLAVETWFLRTLGNHVFSFTDAHQCRASKFSRWAIDTGMSIIWPHIFWDRTRFLGRVQYARWLQHWIMQPCNSSRIAFWLVQIPSFRAQDMWCVGAHAAVSDVTDDLEGRNSRSAACKSSAWLLGISRWLRHSPLGL